MKICILVGHGKGDSGGYDPGAVNGDYHEFNIAKEIAQIAAEGLRSTYGADCGLLNYDGKYNLKERIAQFQDRTYDLLAEIHLNA
ncbi:MAG: N-acetylmuramoyl-L-alanine amidase, partial [Candidatus Merdivicinus sp.]